MTLTQFKSHSFSPGMIFKIGKEQVYIWIKLASVDFETGECESPSGSKYPIESVIEFKYEGE